VPQFPRTQMHKLKKILSPEFRYVFCVYVSISALLQAAYALFRSIQLHPWWNDNLAKLHHAQTLSGVALSFAIIAYIAWQLRTKKSAKEHDPERRGQCEVIHQPASNFPSTKEDIAAWLHRTRKPIPESESRKKRSEET
jgi:hypothetical protein